MSSPGRLHRPPRRSPSAGPPASAPSEPWSTAPKVAGRSPEAPPLPAAGARRPLSIALLCEVIRDIHLSILIVAERMSEKGEDTKALILGSFH